MCKLDYYKRDEWSQSQMKNILDHGIDYAVAAKRGMLPEPQSKAIDLGQLAHMFVLGGDPEIFALSPYSDFRTKEARNWKAEQLEAGKYIVDQSQYDDIWRIVDNIEAHSMSKKLLKGDNVKHEQELFGQISGIEVRGKADAVLKEGDSLIITDIKTTAKFDDFKYKAMRNHYDLQAALYSLIGASAFEVKPAYVNFYFCVAETIEPFRVQYYHCSLEFLEHGEAKLSDCIKKITEFGNKEPNFLIEEVGELGDWSI